MQRRSSDSDVTLSDIHGLKVLYFVENPSVDIIFIHGLDGNWKRTWTTDDGKVHWPKHLLPQKIPNARVWTWGYDSRTYTDSHNDHIDIATIYQHAIELIRDIVDERREDGTSQIPIIFVVHSLGGIILKEALLHSDQCRDGHFADRRSVKVSTCGIIFMSTPHQGTKEVSITQVFRCMARIRGNTSNVLVKYLQKHNEFLQKQISEFTSISQDFEIAYVYESYPTPVIGGPSKLIVPQWSAIVQGTPNADHFSIKKDHVQMTKFPSLDDEGFKKIYRKLNHMIEKTRPKLESNEKVEDRDNVVLKSFRVSFSLKGTPGIKKFIPRDQEMGALENALLPEMRSAERTIFVLYGLGGLGKTQLALAFARKYQEHYSAVFWLDGRSKGKLEQSLAGIARRLPAGQISDEVRIKEPQNQEDLTRAIEEVREWLSQDHNKHWLLIYDNIDRDNSLEENDSEAYDIENYLPLADQGSILITTRMQRLCSLGQDRELARMTMNEGVELLANQRELKPQDNILAQKLVDLVGGLPICLAHAASYMKRTNTGIEGYLEIYDRTWNQLMVDQAKYHDHKNHDINVITIWVMSYDNIKQEDEDAAQMLSLWVCLDSGDIWFGLFNNVEDAPLSVLPEWYRRATSKKGKFNRIVGTLRAYSMIEAKEELDAFAVHPVVQKWCYNNLHPVGQRSFHWLATIIVGSAIPLANNRGPWSIFSRILPHIYQCCWRISLFYFEDFPEEAQLQLFHAYHRMSIPCMILGESNLATFFITLAYAGFVRKVGCTHMKTIETARSLGIMYCDNGKLNLAKRIYKFVILILEVMSLFGMGSAIGLYSDLGSISLSRGLYDEAEGHFKTDLRGQERTIGRDDLSNLKTVWYLSRLYREKQNFEKERASLFWILVRTWNTDSVSFDHFLKSDTMINLGMLYIRRGMIIKGVYLYQKSLLDDYRVRQDCRMVLDVARELSVLFRRVRRDTEADALSQWAENPKAKNLNDVLPPLPKLDFDERRLIEGKLTPEQLKSMYEEAYRRFKEVTGC